MAIGDRMHDDHDGGDTLDEILDDVLDEEVRELVREGEGASEPDATTGPVEIDRLLESLASLGELLLDEAGVDEAVTRVLDVAMRALGSDAHAVSVTVSELRDPARSFVTRDATEPWARDLDEWQYEHGEGPCFHADATGERCVVTDTSHDERFPAFAEEAKRTGVEACASYPMIVRGRSLGSINVFYRDATQLDESTVEAGERLADGAAPLLANWMAHGRVTRLTDQLREALESRGTIERAKGVLMGRLGIGADRAFELLRTQSNHENRPLREVAEELLARDA